MKTSRYTPVQVVYALKQAESRAATVAANFVSGQQVAIATKLPADAAWSEPWQRGWADAPRGYAYASFLVGKKRLGVYCLHLKSKKPR